VPPYRLTGTAPGPTRVLREEGQELVIRGTRPPLEDTEDAHLEFALKHEGVSLEVLAAYFRARGPEVEGALTRLVEATPTGVYARRLWCLYEWLTGRTLPLPALSTGNYQPLLDPALHVTAPGRGRFKRQRLVDNLLGVRDFCPMVRRTEALRAREGGQLGATISELVGRYPEAAIRRAVNYLYTRETRSSFEIEHERPDDRRTERYLALLRSAERIPALSEAELVRIQNETVDPRFAEAAFRTEQNYVGQTLGLAERVHYLPPRPQELRPLMAGWLATASRLAEGGLDPVVHAGLLSFGFVFLHPFLDGNGRMHRLLIHHVLSRRGFTPPGLIFPVSAVIVRREREYDDCLESFSRPVMALVEHRMDEHGRVTVAEDTSALYRYPDLTRMVEALHGWVADTIETDFRHELDFVVEYQAVQEELRRLVDVPDRLLRLFVRLTVQNGGRLASSRRARFQPLTEEELQAMEAVVQRHLPGLAAAADLA
jgi:hypothetical protein